MGSPSSFRFREPSGPGMSSGPVIRPDTNGDTLKGLEREDVLGRGMKVQLDAASKRILFAMLASPKTPAEVSRIYGIPVSVVWQRVAWLRELGLLREVFAYVDASGTLRRYFEALLPVDESEDAEELVVRT